MRIFKKLRFALLAMLLVLALGSCAIDGTSYLALDYSGNEPFNMSFPAFPSFFYWGAFYEHEEGTWNGQYEIYDDTPGTFRLYIYTYTIEVNPGEGFIFGTPGDDRNYTMWLEEDGPLLYYYDVTAGLLPKSEKTRNPASNSGTVDITKYDMDHPVPFSSVREDGPYIFSIEGNSYRLK